MENLEEIFNEILEYSPDEAFKYCNDNFKSSGSPEWLIYLAHVHLVKECYEEAIASVELGFELGCDNYTYGYAIKGRALLDLNLLIESREAFNIALGEEPENFLINQELIKLDILEGFYEEGIKRAENYIDHYCYDNKLICELKTLIGWIYLESLNDSGMAKEYFIEGISIYNKFSESYTGLGICFMCYRNYNNAINNFKLSLEINKTDYRNYLGIALCYKELEEYEEVEEYLIKANGLNCEETRIIEEYAFELIRQDRQEEAVEYLKEIAVDSESSIEITRLIRELEN